MKFDKVYKAPFTYDGYVIWADDNVHALDCLDYSEGFDDRMQRVTKLLNGEQAEKFEGLSLRSSNSDCLIVQNGKPILEIRGWGLLTGKLALKGNVAAHIQDDFGSWVISKISK